MILLLHSLDGRILATNSISATLRSRVVLLASEGQISWGKLCFELFQIVRFLMEFRHIFGVLDFLGEGELCVSFIVFRVRVLH